MAKVTKGAFYAVHSGYTPGIYSTWDDCEAQIKHFPGAKFKRFSTQVEATEFVRTGAVGPTPGASKSSAAGTRAKVQDTRKALREGTLEVADESEWDIVFTDGACKGNGNVGSVAGVGVWYGPDDVRNIAERCPGKQTNNCAELTALVRCLEATPHSKRSLLLKTDSKYCRDCMQKWLPNWRRNGFKTAGGKPVINKELLLYLSALLDQRSRVGQTVKLQYVQAHCGIEGNEGADALANLGCRQPEVEESDWDTLRTALKEIVHGLDEVEVIEEETQKVEVGRRRAPITPGKTRTGKKVTVVNISDISDEDSEMLTMVAKATTPSQPLTPGSQPWTRKPPKDASQTPTKARRELVRPKPAVVAAPPPSTDFSLYNDDVLSAEDLQRELDED